jgi:hypothetical protein
VALDYGCAMLIDRNDLPNHLFGIPDLDLSEDLCAEPLAGTWFRLGAWSADFGRDKQGVENVVYRQSMLLSPEDFSVIFDKLESIVGDIGKPGGSPIGAAGYLKVSTRDEMLDLAKKARLVHDDIRAALKFAGELVEQEQHHPFPG